MFEKVKKIGIESKCNNVLKKGYMHVVIIVESTTIVLLIVGFQPKLVPIFSHKFHKGSQKLYSKLEFYYYCCHHYWCKGKRG
jgi:hypothetical protein